MTPDLPTRVREAFEAPEVVDAVARAIAEQGIRALDGKEATWERHADGFRGMARDALAAIPDTALAAVIAVVQEDRTREIVAWLRDATATPNGHFYADTIARRFRRHHP